jgi:pimeloyl-ACP methyl ester carboxylesterase
MFIPRDIDIQLEEIAHRLFSDEFLRLPDTEQSDPALNFPTNRDRFAAGELDKRLDKQGFTRKGFMLQAIAGGWHYKSAAQIKQLAEAVGPERIAVLHGTSDRMITYHHAEMLKDQLGPGIVFRVWEGKGHVLRWEEEVEFNSFLESFFEQMETKS